MKKLTLSQQMAHFLGPVGKLEARIFTLSFFIFSLGVILSIIGVILSTIMENTGQSHNTELIFVKCIIIFSGISTLLITLKAIIKNFIFTQNNKS